MSGRVWRIRRPSCACCARRRAGPQTAGRATCRRGASKRSRSRQRLNSRAGVVSATARKSADGTSDSRLDRLGRGSRVSRIADRPADHDVVGPVRERFLDCHDALLIVARAVLDRPDAVRDYQQTLTEMLAQELRFEAGRDDAIATRFQGPAGTREHQLFNVTAETEVVEIATIETGEHGDGKNLDVALRLRRSFHDGLIAVHGREAYAAIAQAPHCGRNRGRDIEELEIDEYPVALADHPVEQLEVLAGHEELEPELVEAHRVTQAIDQSARAAGVGDVESEDQALTRGDVLFSTHVRSAGLKRRLCSRIA